MIGAYIIWSKRWTGPKSIYLATVQLKLVSNLTLNCTSKLILYFTSGINTLCYERGRLQDTYFFFHSKVTTTWIILARIWVSVWDRTCTPWNTISATFGWSCFYERKTHNVCSNSQVGSLSCWCLVLREIFPLFQCVLVTLFAILSLSLFPFLFNLCSLLLFYLPHLPFFC